MSENGKSNKSAPPAAPGSAAQPPDPKKGEPQPATVVSEQQAEKALQAFAEKESEQEKETARQAAATGYRRPGLFRGFFAHFFKIRDEPTILGRLFMGGLFLVAVLVLWFLVTRGKPEERILSINVIGSPEEMLFGTPDKDDPTKLVGGFSDLWFDRALMRNLVISLWRVIQGFLLAAAIAVPLGILCGTFKRFDAFLAPISIFGRNVPISALLPLTLVFFSMGESQKVGFIFMACVAFVLFDTTRSIDGVHKDYLETAYTLGASRLQMITKVLIPLAMPNIFNSLRLLFGLAFGYIVLAEGLGMEGGGVGVMIYTSQRLGKTNHIYLILIFITLAAFVIDRLLYKLNQYLFPYRQGRS